MIAAILSGLKMKSKRRRRLPGADGDDDDEEQDENDHAKWMMVVGRPVPEPDSPECKMTDLMFKQKASSAISRDDRKIFGQGSKLLPVDTYLTDSMLVLAKRNSKVQLDQVPLEEISKVTLAHDEEGIRESDVGGAGWLLLRATRRSETSLNMEASAKNLTNKDGFLGMGKSDPFLRVLLCADGAKRELMRTEVVHNNLNPEWKPMEIDLGVPFSDHTRLEIQCWDSDRGEETTIQTLLSSRNTAVASTGENSRDDLIGLLSVEVGELLMNQSIDARFGLKFYHDVDQLGSDSVVHDAQMASTNRLAHSKIGANESGLPQRSHSAESKQDLTDSSILDPGSLPSEMVEHNNSLSLFCFHVYTISDGHNCGTTYTLYTKSEHLRTKWVDAIEAQKKAVLARIQAETYGTFHSVWKVQAQIKRCFDSRPVQGFVGLCIASAFVTNVIESEYLGTNNNIDGELSAVLGFFEAFYVYIFTVELSFNFISNFFWVFVKDAWNYLDALVVAVSWVSLALPEGGVGTIKVVRLLRVFRVIRVIKRFKSLRRIVKALLASVIPVSYSLMLLLLATAIFAVVAVDTMAEDEPVLFGSFSLAFFTMWQVGTGDGWSEVARRFTREDGTLHPLTSIFFGGYVFVVGLVLINIVVAVLLDEFITTVSHEKLQEAEELELAKRIRDGIFEVRGPLDRIMRPLSKFTSHQELLQMTDELFNVLDVDHSGAISFAEALAGLKRLRVSINEDEWMQLTAGISDGAGTINRKGFAAMMQRQLKAFAQRQVVNSMRAEANGSLYEVHLCLKMLMSDAEAGDEGGAGAKPTDLGQRVARIESALQDSSVRHEGRLASMETSLQAVRKTQNTILQMLTGLQARRVESLRPLPRSPSSVSINPRTRVAASPRQHPTADRTKERSSPAGYRTLPGMVGASPPG